MKIKTVETTKKKATKKASVKKTTAKKTTKKPASKKLDTNMNLWTRDENGDLAIVVMKPEYKMQFIEKFGVEEIPTKVEFETWYSEIYLK